MKTAALWVSHAKDLEWFRVSARSYARNARGFDFAKVVVPNSDIEAFRSAAEPHGISVCGFGQHPTKGFLHHMIMKCRGDEHFPAADVVFHFDSDCIFAVPFHPDHYAPGGVPMIRFRDWDELKDHPTYVWRGVVERTLGGRAERACMTDHPFVHLRETYIKTRQEIERIHRCPFDEYLFRQRNEFPQSFCEFETLGVIAYRFFKNRYVWRDSRRQGHPPLKILTSWCHRQGFDFVMDYPTEMGGKQTARQLFQRLGLL